MRDHSVRSNLLASLTIHIVLVGAFALMFTVFKRPDPGPGPVEVVFYKPGEYVPPPPPPIPEPEPERGPEPEPEPEPEPQIAQVEPEPLPEPVRPEPEPVPEVRVAELRPPKPEPVAPRPVLQPKPEPPKPKRPRREIKTNVLNASVPKPATKLQTEKRTVKTDAFGAGDEETPVRRERLRAGTQVGNFVVADNVDPTAPKTRRATVQTSGFGSAEAGETPRRGGGDADDVQTGGFGSTSTAKRPKSSRKVQAEAPDTPVEILSKPTPAYTSAARDLRVEGEVALRVTFLAGGSVKVIQVIDGLGHGLDESATEAAKRIRFKPARRDGQPVDHTATIRIVFQLV